MKLNKKKLEIFKERLGQMTSAEALEIALQSEQIASDCSPLDPAHKFFKEQQYAFEVYAGMLELSESDIDEVDTPGGHLPYGGGKP